MEKESDVMIESINTIAHNDREQFLAHLTEYISKMQAEKLTVEVQYTTNIELNGRLIFTAMLIGRSNIE